MKEEERILRRYLNHPLYDDTDLYYNGLCSSTEFLDHKLDHMYKKAVFDLLMSGTREQKESAFKKPPFPYHNIPRSKRSPNRIIPKIPNPNTAVVIQNHINESPKQAKALENNFRINRPISKSPNPVTAVVQNHVNEAPNQAEALENYFRIKFENPTISKNPNPITAVAQNYISETPKQAEAPENNFRLKFEKRTISKTPNLVTAVVSNHIIETPKQAESLEKDFRINFKIGVNTILSVIPQRPQEKNESDCSSTKKRKINEELGYLRSNIPAILKARLQKNNAILLIKKKLMATGAKENNSVAIPERQILNSEFSVIPQESQRADEKNESEGSSTKKRRKGEDVGYLEHNIPEKVKARLQKNKAILVIRKNLTATDVKESNARLALPERQIINHDFLTEKEVMWLSERDGTAVRHLNVRLIDPSGDECEIKLARWTMGVNVVYNLLTPWKHVVARNKLREYNLIEVYSFVEGQKLYFAVIKV